MKMNRIIGCMLAIGTSTLLVACGGKQENQANANTSTVETATESTGEVAMMANNEQAKTQELAAISFEETDFDFGQVTDGETVEHTFKFTNTGTAPLIIQDVKPTCGCTTPNYTREPVAPGETGEIQLRFNSQNRVGVANKPATVVANIPNGQTTIRLKGEVMAAGGAPLRQ